MKVLRTTIYCTVLLSPFTASAQTLGSLERKRAALFRDMDRQSHRQAIEDQTRAIERQTQAFEDANNRVNSRARTDAIYAEMRRSREARELRNAITEAGDKAAASREVLPARTCGWCMITWW
jgi:hypothetical protein